MEEDLIPFSFIGKDIKKLSDLYNIPLVQRVSKPSIDSNRATGIIIFIEKQGVCTWLLYTSTGSVIKYFDPNLLFAKYERTFRL